MEMARNNLQKSRLSPWYDRLNPWYDRLNPWYEHFEPLPPRTATKQPN